jgi:outer membrane biosynthesis protein TonB
VKAGVSVSNINTNSEPESNSWVNAHEVARRRSFVRALVISFALHLAVGFYFVFAPQPDPIRTPSVISVRMVTMPSAPPAAARPSKKIAPTDAPEPEPLPAKPKPMPVAKKVILPKRAVVTKKSKPKPKPKPLEYDDALAALRAELGEETPPADVPAVVAEVEIPVPDDSDTGGAQASGQTADPKFVAWQIATLRHIRRILVVPKEFMDRSLSTDLIVTLSVTGEVLGYEITRASSDPYWEDIVRRAWVRASPLPPPPTAGDWHFQFVPEEGN